MTFFDLSLRHPVLLKASAVHRRLADAFYSIHDGYRFVLRRGLLIDIDSAGDAAERLAARGFRPGRDFGVGYPVSRIFRRCEGIGYGPAGGTGERAWATDGWTEERLPRHVRDEHLRRLENGRKAQAQLDRFILDATCKAARAEGIPQTIVDWANLQPWTLRELNEVRESVAALRASGVAEATISEALAGPHFLRDLFALRRSLGAA